MKRTWFILPLLTIAALLTGCKSDDDSPRPSSPTPSAELEAEYERMDMERFAVMELLHSLAGVTFEADFEDDIDFEGQTYEPVIGEVRDDARPLERFLRVEDASFSEQDFRDLVGDATFIRQTADGCVIDLTHLDCRDDGRKQNFGTLTFHRNTDGSNAGYAEVNVPCIPHLQRIVYLTKEQWGDNAELFESPCTKGDIYFGRGVYWVCVEEALSESTKGVLVNVEPGYGTLHNLLWDANYEAHNSYFPTRSDIRAYLRFCADPDFATLKKRILKNPAYDNKIFPRLCSNHSKSSFSFSVGKGDYGFATTEPYYSEF